MCLLLVLQTGRVVLAWLQVWRVVLVLVQIRMASGLRGAEV